MLKTVDINEQKIPIPVPIRTLVEAIEWVNQTLVKDGNIITKVCLDGVEIDDDLERTSIRESVLNSTSVLKIQVDSPKELALQTIEGMTRLFNCIQQDLKPIAVECWQVDQGMITKRLGVIISDIDLGIDLIEHLSGLIDSTQVEAAPVQGLAMLVRKVSAHLKQERESRDWKRCARILLVRMEPLLEDLIKESENLQLQVFASNATISDPWPPAVKSG